MTLEEIVKRTFLFKPPCYIHCNREAAFTRLVKGKERIVGAYVCPSNFVSRVVYFALRPNLSWFRSWLAKQMTDPKILDDRDIRVATRHPWETRESRAPPITAPRTSGLTPYLVREVYWAYPRANLIDDKTGAFRCRECEKIFVQPLDSRSSLCDSCRKR